MEKKKNIRNKIFIIIGIIILGLVIYVVCIHRGTTEENKKDLTIIEKITLNDNEKELLSELVNVNDKLLHPTQSEDTNSLDYVNAEKPTEPISLKEFCIKLYEARKTTNENGETIYIFDMDTKGNNGEVVRRKIFINNGEMIFTFTDSEIEEVVENVGDTTISEEGINLGKDFAKAMLQGINNSANELWEKANTYNNVNYDNILKEV